VVNQKPFGPVLRAERKSFLSQLDEFLQGHRAGGTDADNALLFEKFKRECHGASALQELAMCKDGSLPSSLPPFYFTFMACASMPWLDKACLAEDSELALL